MNKYINADDYKELIEREKAECYPTDDEFEDGCKTGLEIAVEVIDEMPTADVVEVVRCKDCKKYKLYAYPYLCGECGNCSYDVPAKIVKEDGYCDEGERKESK